MRHGTLFNGRGCHWPPLDLASLCESSASIRTYNFGSLRSTGKYVFVKGGGGSEVQFHNARPRDRRCRRYEVVQASFPIDRPGCSPYAAHTHTQSEREAVRWDLLFHSKFNLPDRSTTQVSRKACWCCLNISGCRVQPMSTGFRSRAKERRRESLQDGRLGRVAWCSKQHRMERDGGAAC